MQTGVRSVNRFLQSNLFTENFPGKAKSITDSIVSHLEAGRLRKAVSLLFGSPFPFSFPLYAHLFKLCSTNRAILQARKVESHLVTYYDPPPTFLLNRAIETYGKCGCLRDARQLFDEMPQRNGGAWNAMITAYAQGGSPNESLKLFLDMIRSGCSPNEVTFASVLGCCGDLLELGFSRMVHGFIIKVGLSRNVILASALVDVYGKCDVIIDARKMFDEISCPNDVSWNVIVRRYVEVGDERQAIYMFFQSIRAGVKPLSFTFSNALVAVSGCQAFLEGLQIHGVATKCRYGDDEIVATSLIKMYMRCNDVLSARRIFDQLNNKDLLSWTAVLSGYAMAGRHEEAEELFNEMPEQCTVSWNVMLAGYIHFGRWAEALNIMFMICQEINYVDGITLNLMLNVCVALSDIDLGKQVHAYMHRHGFISSKPLSTVLICMYKKCGALRHVQILFNYMGSPRDTSV